MNDVVDLIHDGSTDGSRKVIQELAHEDHRFKYLFLIGTMVKRPHLMLDLEKLAVN